MFYSPELVFLELQKTGCTHIKKLLTILIPEGEQVGKHIRLDSTNKVRHEKTKFLGSVRNPLTWYISQWNYGCDNKGLLKTNLTNKSIYGHGITHAGALKFLKSLSNEVFKPVSEWKEVYTDAKNPELFRKWLKMILNPKRKYDLLESYGFSSISNIAGLYTYRYFYLYSKDLKNVYNEKFHTIEDLIKFDQEQNILDFTIKTEELEKDFFIALEKFGIELSGDQKEMIMNMPKTNPSSQEKKLDYYYDQESLDLVREKEAFFFNKFGY